MLSYDCQPIQLNCEFWNTTRQDILVRNLLLKKNKFEVMLIALSIFIFIN